MSRLISALTALLSTLAIVGAVPAAPGSAGHADPDVPAALDQADAVVTLPPGNTGIIIQNLQASQSATAGVVVRLPDGTAVLSTTVGPLRPGAAQTVDLGAHDALPVGWLTAEVTSRAPVAVLARTAWPGVPGPRARPGAPVADVVALANAAVPGPDLVVPVVMKDHLGATSVVVVRNADAARPVAVDARVMRLDQGTAVWQRRYDLPPAGAAALDFGGVALADLPLGFVGTLRITAGGPVAAHALHGIDTLGGSEMAVAALPAFPASAAATEWHTSFLSFVPNAFGAGVIGSAFVVHNPGAAPATVDVTYTGTTDSDCAGQAFTHPVLTVPPGATVEVSQRADGGSGLPARCWGTAAVRASAPVLAQQLEVGPLDEPRYVTAFPALAVGDFGMRLGIPLVRNLDGPATAGNTGLMVFNPNPTESQVLLRLFDAAGTELSGRQCPACTRIIAAGQVHTWSPFDGSLPSGVDGGAIVEVVEGSAVAALGSELLAYGGRAFAASPAAFRSGTHLIPFAAHAARVAAPTAGLPPATPPPAPTAPAVPPRAPHVPVYTFGDTTAEAGTFGRRDHMLGVAVDRSRGLLYVADAGNHRIQVLTDIGRIADAWGSRGTAPGQLQAPGDVAVGPDGSVYVLDTENFRVQRFDPQGRFQGMWGGPGAAPGQLGASLSTCESRACGPGGIAVAGDGTVWVADTWNRRLQHFGPTGALLGIVALAASGEQGYGGKPIDVAVAPDGTVWTHIPDEHHLRRYAPDGTPRGRFPQRDDGPDALGFEWVTALAVADDGAVWVAGAGEGDLARWDAGGKRQAILLSGGDEWNNIAALAPAGGGAVWAAAAGRQRIVRVDPDGRQGAWVGGPRGASDEPLPLGPRGLDVAPDGTVVVVGARGDDPRHAAWRRFDLGGRAQGDGLDGETWRRVAAGTGGTWYAAVGGQSFAGTRYVVRVSDSGKVLDRVFLPSGVGGEAEEIAVAPDGTLVVMLGDGRRLFERRILRLAPGGALAATWLVDLSSDPFGRDVEPRVAAAADGSVFMLTGSRVRRYGPDGRLEAEWGSVGTGLGQLRAALDLDVGPDGTVYVADAGNDRVQRFRRDGALLSVWPAHVPAEVVDDNGDTWPDSVRLTDIAVADDGRVLVLDERQNRVLAYAPPQTETPGAAVMGHGRWRRSAFDNRWLAGMPFAVDEVPGLAMDGALGVPDGAQSLRWEQTVALAAGWHRVEIGPGADTIRAWIGGQLVADLESPPSGRLALLVRGGAAQAWRIETGPDALAITVRPEPRAREVHLPWVGTR